MSDQNRPVTLADLENFKSHLDKKFDDIHKNFNEIDNHFFNLEKAFNNRLDESDKTFFNWKSDLFTKIDKSYATPLKRQQQEANALLVRSKRHEKAINKINKHLGFPTFA